MRVEMGEARTMGALLLHGGEFMAPMYGPCVDQQGSLFVVDNGNNRVHKFDHAGNFIIVEVFGSANSNSSRSTGVACDGKGDVWVVDTDDDWVQKFDGKLGGYLMKFGSRGNGEGQFNAPWGLRPTACAVTSMSSIAPISVYRNSTCPVSSSWPGQLRQRGRAILFPSRSGGRSRGRGGLCRRYGKSPHPEIRYQHQRPPAAVTKWGGSSTPGHASSSLAQEAGQLRSPWGISIDGAGDVYVTDTGNHRIEKFDREGNFITQWGGFGNGGGQFNFPYGIAVDAKGSVFVIDSGNTRVQQFMPAEEGSERLQDEAEELAELENAQGTQNV